MIIENPVITEREIADLENQIKVSISERDQAWIEIQKNFTSNYEVLENVLHVAGGGLPLIFGKEENEIWQKIIESAGEAGVVNIAGIKFSIEDLKLIGEFYNFVKKKGYNFHCIDERLDERHELNSSCVHDHCGACGAVQVLIQESLGISLPVEDNLVETFDLPGKQGLIEGTEEEHSTSTIAVTYADHAATLKDYLIPLFMEKKALSMNITIPIDLIRNFYEEKSKTDSSITSTSPVYELLIRWNIGIARAVIGGIHNTERNIVGQELLVSNYYGAEAVSPRAMEENKKIRTYLGGNNRNLMYSSFEEPK